MKMTPNITPSRPSTLKDCVNKRKQLRVLQPSILQGAQAPAAFGEVLKMKNAEPDDAQQSEWGGWAELCHDAQGMMPIWIIFEVKATRKIKNERNHACE